MKFLVIFLFCLHLNEVQGKSFAIKDYLYNDCSRWQAKKIAPFRVANIRARFDFNQNWEVASSNALIKSINSILDQPFIWLAHGYQTYAFLSTDGKYVLKFFQTQHSKSFRFIQQNFIGTKLAFDDLPKESGIMFVHINRTENLLRTIEVYDSEGKRYLINGNDVCFFVQAKADYVLPTIEKLMENGHLELAKRRIDHVFELIYSLTKKSIADNDRILIENNNVGFVNDRAIYIDCGHLVKDRDLDAKKRINYELKNRLVPLYNWLNQNYPQLAAHYKIRESEILAKF